MPKVVQIGSARISETGTAGWDGRSKAGDQKQTAETNDRIGEVSMQDFYVSSKGWYVLVWKNPEYAKRAAEEMVNACDNKNIGYDQSQRYTLSNEISSNKLKSIKDVAKPCETDCSRLVHDIVKIVSGKEAGDFNTESEVVALEATGLFEKAVKYTNESQLITGAILVTCTKGHTVIVVVGYDYPETAATPIPVFKPYKVRLTSTLFMRKGPGSNYKAIASNKPGHEMTIREEKDGWGRVICYPDSVVPKTAVEGWISLKYVTRV